MNAKGNPSNLSPCHLCCSAGKRPVKLGQELYGPAQILACREDCGSSYCQLAGGTRQSRYACRCCASLARRGCSQGRSHRGRNTCAAPVSPAAAGGGQLSELLGNGVSCVQAKHPPLLWDGSHISHPASDLAAVLSYTQGRAERREQQESPTLK